jgi:hypothetical protein
MSDASIIRTVAALDGSRSINAASALSLGNASMS